MTFSLDLRVDVIIVSRLGHSNPEPIGWVAAQSIQATSYAGQEASIEQRERS
jgi:hypothetical protein